MKLATGLRTPYLPRTIVRSGTTGRLGDASLRRAFVVARTVVATLCAARAGTDWLHGQATFEGGVALVLVVAFTIWLTVEAIGEGTCAAAPALGDTPYRSSRPRGVRAGDGRAT